MIHHGLQQESMLVYGGVTTCRQPLGHQVLSMVPQQRIQNVTSTLLHSMVSKAYWLKVGTMDGKTTGVRKVINSTSQRLILIMTLRDCRSMHCQRVSHSSLTTRQVVLQRTMRTSWKRHSPSMRRWASRLLRRVMSII